MKTSVLKKWALASVTVGLTMANVNAQSGASTFLKSGVSDGNKLMNAYLSPLMTGFASGLNNGWYQTAKAHGIGGFDITMNAGLVLVPTSAKSFDIGALGLNTDPSKPRITPSGGGSLGTAPTIFGDDKSTTKVDVRQQFTVGGNTVDTVVSSFDLPAGTNANMSIYLPNAQFCVGVYKKTDLIIRFIPSINTGDFKAGAFGIGIKHDFKQWIPGIAEAPFDMSAIVAYNSSSAEYGLGNNFLKPDSTYPGAQADNVYKDSQKFKFTMSGWMVGAVISKKLGPLTPFLGINYNVSKATLDVSGMYPVTFMEDDATNPNFGKKKIVNFSDPFSITGDANSFRLNAGLRLKLGPITFHGDYTLAPYSTVNFGLGINIQSIAPFKL